MQETLSRFPGYGSLKELFLFPSKKVRQTKYVRKQDLYRVEFVDTITHEYQNINPSFTYILEV